MSGTRTACIVLALTACAFSTQAARATSDPWLIGDEVLPPAPKPGGAPNAGLEPRFSGGTTVSRQPRAIHAYGSQRLAFPTVKRPNSVLRAK